MAKSLVPVVLIAILAGALGLALRLASLLQALFQRLGRLEHARDTTGRGAGIAAEEPPMLPALDALLVEDLLRVAQRQVRRHARLGVLAWLGAFLTAAHVARLRPRKRSPAALLRQAQRLLANPYRWCDYALAVDRWGRSVDLRCHGHAFSDIGVFWYVVNRLEAQGYWFEQAFLDGLEAAIVVAGRLLQPARAAAPGAVFPVAQYELVIRMCQDDALASLWRHVPTSLPHHPLRRETKHRTLHHGGAPPA